MIRLSLSIDKTNLPSEANITPHFANAIAVTARTWADKYLPKHFQQGAAQRYGYRPRSSKYLARKKALAARGVKVVAGGMLDLVFSGSLANAAENLNTTKSVGLKSTVHISAPSYAKYRGMLFEFTRLTVGEESELSTVCERTLNSTLNKPTITAPQSSTTE